MGFILTALTFQYFGLIQPIVMEIAGVLPAALESVHREISQKGSTTRDKNWSALALS